jgi:hypothetical protein
MDWHPNLSAPKAVNTPRKTVKMHSIINFLEMSVAIQLLIGTYYT